MKRLILFFTFLFVPVALILAQEPVEPTVPPVSWGEVFSNPALWLGSFAGFSLLVAFVTAFINGFLKTSKTFLKQLTAWIIAIVGLLVLDFANVKICYAWDFPWWLAVVHGFAAGLASNGFFDIPWLKVILNKIETLFVKS